MRELMRRNRLRDGLVYMQVTRGVARRDHAFPTTPVKPALVLTTKNTKHLGADPGPGVAVKSHPDIRWERCDIKTVALLPNVLAKQAARESGAYEAWLVDDKGCVTEGASTNAWIVTPDDELVTPPDRQRHPGRHHARHAEDDRRRPAAQVRRAAVHAGRSQEGEGGVHHQRHVVRDTGGEDRRRARWATARSARRRGGCARNMCASPIQGEAVT